MFGGRVAGYHIRTVRGFRRRETSCFIAVRYRVATRRLLARVTRTFYEAETVDVRDSRRSPRLGRRV